MIMIFDYIIIIYYFSFSFGMFFCIKNKIDSLEMELSPTNCKDIFIRSSHKVRRRVISYYYLISMRFLTEQLTSLG